MPEAQNQSATPLNAGIPKKDMSALYTPISIIVAGLLVAGGLFFGLSGKSGSGTQEPVTKPVDIVDVDLSDEPFIGKIDAPVVLALWSDYQCPFCKAVEVGGIPQIPIEPAFPSLIEEYVETGKLKIVFKDYPFLSEDSITAALYEHAVWKLYPGKFYTWREAMYKAQDEEHGGFGDEESIIALSKKIAGIDTKKLQADVEANVDAYKAEIDADREEGSSFGITGTPGFITGTQLIPGAAEFSEFKAAIDAQLK